LEKIRFLIWKTLKIQFLSNDRKYKVNIGMARKALKIGSQEEHIRGMLNHFKEKGLFY